MTGQPSSHAPSELRDFAASLATQAAMIALAERRSIDGAFATADTKSSPSDLVTEVDRANETLIVGRIMTERPGDGVIGEEGSEHPSTSGVEWIIDPIDGTTSFVHGYPGWTVSVAAAVDGAVVAGAVADPTHLDADGEVSVFSAALGFGAHRNGVKLSVSSCTQLSRSLIGTGFSFDARTRQRQAAVLGELFPRIRDIRRCGSAALELCRVAAGEIDGFFEIGLNRWDSAAGLLIVLESGGTGEMVVADDLSPSFTVASTPGITAEFDAALHAAGASLA